MALQKGRVVPKGIRKLCDLLNLFLNRYETGLLCFFSEKEPLPDMEDVMRMLDTGSPSPGMRVQCSSQVLPAQAAVERADGICRMIDSYGGMEAVRETCRIYGALYPEKAKILKQISQIGGLKYSCIEDVAEENGTYARKIQRVRYKAIHQIAREIYSASARN